jgi:hypothetical protein
MPGRKKTEDGSKDRRIVVYLASVVNERYGEMSKDLARRMICSEPLPSREMRSRMDIRCELVDDMMARRSLRREPRMLSNRGLPGFWQEMEPEDVHD